MVRAADGSVRIRTEKDAASARTERGNARVRTGRGVARIRTERGAGTALVALTAVAVMLGAVMVLTVSTYVVALHRARAAADLSALAAAQAAVTGSDGCQAARELAAAHRAGVSHCRQNGGQGSVAVSVTTTVDLRWRMPGLPATVSTTAHAGTSP